MDKMTREDLLHLCKAIIVSEQRLNLTVDELLKELGITREEAKNGEFHQEIDTS